MGNNTVSTHSGDPSGPPRRPIDSGSLYQQAAYDERYTDPKTEQQRIRHHAAVWVGSISVIDSKGRRQRRKVTGATPEEVSSKFRALTRAKLRQELPTGSRHTLQWLRDEWLKSRQHRAQRTRAFYEQMSRLYVLPELGTLTLRQLDQRDARSRLQQWVNDLAKRIEPKTAKHARDILRSILRYGMDGGYLSHDTTKKPELPTIATASRCLMILLHGTIQEVAETNARFVDIGLSLIRLIEAIPRETYRVVDMVDVYETPELKVPDPNVKGVVLEVSSQTGQRKDKRVLSDHVDIPGGELVAGSGTLERPSTHGGEGAPKISHY